MENFQVGDVVRLKSGGPNMTVEAVTGDNILVYYWHDQEGRFLRQEFPNKLLLRKV